MSEPRLSAMMLNGYRDLADQGKMKYPIGTFQIYYDLIRRNDATSFKTIAASSARVKWAVNVAGQPQIKMTR